MCFVSRVCCVQAQQLMRRVQEVVQVTEGFINKFLVDDKGLLILAAYGVPPCLHTDDAFRAVRAGMTLIDTCKVRL